MRKNLFYSFKSYVVSLGHPTLYYSRNISSSVGLLFKILNLKLPSWVDLKLCRLCFIVCFLTEGKALLACFCVTGEQSQKQHKMAKIYYDFCFFVVFSPFANQWKEERWCPLLILSLRDILPLVWCKNWPLFVNYHDTFSELPKPCFRWCSLL